MKLRKFVRRNAMFCNLNAEMRRKGITGARLAQLLGMTPTTLSLKLNGKSELSLRQCLPEIKPKQPAK